MNLTERLDVVVDVMKLTKEQWVSHEPENPDLAMYLHFFRCDDLIATAQCPLDRDIALQAAYIGAPGFEATTLTMTFESYHSHLKKSPITGERWMPREMQFVAQTRTAEALEKGWVTECLTTSAHERGGVYGLHSQPYVIRDGKVEWSEPTVVISEKEGETGGGLMFDNLQAAMSTPVMSERLEEESKNNPLAAMANGLITDPERRSFHMDMATSRALEEKELVVGVMLMAEEGTERQQWLAERLEEQNTEENPPHQP